MDSYKNTSNKIQKMQNQVQINEFTLPKKELKLSLADKRLSVGITPTIIYDSGWQGYPTTAIGETATYGTSVGLYTNFIFSKEINIPRLYLGNAKINIIVKKQPELDVIGLTDFRPMEYQDILYSSGKTYQEIYGNGTLIYKGKKLNNSLDKYHTEDELNNEDFNINYTTKWFRGSTLDDIYSLKWTTKYGVKYRWHYPTLYYVYTYWNVSVAGNGQLNYSYWRGYSFTNVTSTSISGYGIYKTKTWVYNPATSQWEAIYTNAVGHKTVPLFQNTTAIGCNHGELQYWNGTTWKPIDTTGDQIRYAVSDGDFNSGYYDTITSFHFYEDNTYKVHWTTAKLGRQIGSDSNGLINLPRSTEFTGYQKWADGGGAPYTHIYHKVNPGNYPITEEGDTFLYGGRDTRCWAKTASSLKHRLYLNTKITFSAPAKKLVQSEADVYNDDYTPSISGYNTPIEDRTKKPLDLYKAEQQDVQIKVLVTVTQPQRNVDIKKLTINKL